MVVTTKGTCGGHPRVDGTRIEVFNIIGCLSEGMSLEEISEQYNLSLKEVKEAVAWVREFLVEHYDSKLDETNLQ